MQDWEDRCLRGSHNPFFSVYGTTGLLRDPKEICKKYLEISNKCSNGFRF